MSFIRHRGAVYGALAVLTTPVLAQRFPDMRVDADPAGVQSAFTFVNEIAVSGRSVYVTWVKVLPLASPDIHFTRSLDGGATWLEEDVRFETDYQASLTPTIAASGSSVYIAWNEGGFPFGGEIHFNRSLDHGSTWMPTATRLDTLPAGSYFASGPRIAASGSSVYVVWQDIRNSPPFPDLRYDVYFNRSLDGGASWLASDIRLDTDGAGAAASSVPKIAVSGSSVFVVWQDERNGERDIHFNRSLDSGATWLPTDVRLDTDEAGAAASEGPVIAASGSSVYVAWQDERNANLDVYFNRSSDGGTTWLASDVRLDTDPAGAASSDSVQIAASGSSVFVTWRDGRNVGTTDIYVNRSLDGGATWLASDVLIDTGISGAGLALSNSPRIAASGPSVNVAWVDSRNGDPDIYFNRSLDGGTTWLADDVRLDTDAPGAATSQAPAIAASDSSVYVTWLDSRNQIDRRDLYFNIPFGALPYGVGVEGSGGIVPQLTGSGSLNLGGTCTLEVSSGLGGAEGGIGFGFGLESKSAIPMAGGTVLVDPVQVWVPFELDGAAEVPGEGSFIIDIPIPVNVSLLGFNLNSQAGILDSGAPLGVSMTNAVEAWIL